MDAGLHTTVDGVFRLSTWIPDITEHGFTFNQFLLTGEQPFLFHTLNPTTVAIMRGASLP